MSAVFIMILGILRVSQSFLNKKTSKYLNVTKSYLIFGLYFESIASAFALVFVLFSKAGGLNVPTVVCAAITAVAFLAELLTSLRALKSAPLALCTMCSLGGGIVLPTILAIFYFDEPVTLLRGVGIVLFFASVYFLTPRDERKVTLEKTTIIVLACNFLVNGVCSFMGKYFAQRVQNGNSALFACLCYGLSALLFGAVLLMFGKKIKNTNNENAFPKQLYVTGSIVGVVCATIVYLSTELSKFIYVAVLNTVPNAICLVGSLVLGVALFNEKLTFRKITGVVLSVVSTTVIVLF